ncbi:MAG: ABC transporter permease [Methanoregula sp.]|jgi:lipooligosaccharide transport system permease protein
MYHIWSMPRITRRAWKVWHRNLVVFFRTWQVNFFPPLIEAFLYLFAIGMGIGTYVKDIDGTPYINFIAPAILAISVMNSAFFECTYGSYVRMYYQKSFDAMIATPLSIEDVIAGELLWGATRSVMYVIIMLPVLAAFGVISIPASLLAIPLAFLGGLMFAGIAMCFTAITPSIDTLNYPSFLLITPMALFSGTFFPITLLPVLFQYFALALLPLTHLVAIMRMLTLPAFSWTILLHLAWIVIVTAVFCVVAINLMRKRLIV